MNATCGTCPWRRGAKAADMPGGFDVAWARGLRGACRDSQFGAAILTCHHREMGIKAVCFGFLNDQLREDIPNLSVRMAIMGGRLRLPEEPDDDLLSYEEMLEQMEADPSARRKRIRSKV